MEEKKPEKILIIKTGYSETLDIGGNFQTTPSLGDILRTTVLLNLFKNDEVTWVTDKEAFPLLQENPYIKILLPYDLTTVLQLQSEEFDTIINLEKIPGICAFSDKIKAWRRFGFRFNTKTGKAEAYDNAFDVIYVSSIEHAKKNNYKFLQEFLFELVGKKWNGEEYILGYMPKTLENADVLLNTQIGSKWPTKSWPKEKWLILKKLLEEKGLKVSLQEEQGSKVLQNLYGYMDWINSGKVLVSIDSLGMHLGIFMRKKVLGLFGPTPYREVYFYGRGKAILPEPIPPCITCFKGVCERGKNCMEEISVERVFNEILEIISK